jgi:hypothetical protein
MSALSVSLVIAAFTGLGCGVVAFRRASARAKEEGRVSTKFRAKQFGTDKDLAFLGKLEAAVPELRFHVLVSMGALLDPIVTRGDRAAYYRARRVFSRKILKYVAQSRTDGFVVAVVELDDRPEDGLIDAKRDAMLTSVGYRVIRWNLEAMPSVSVIRSELMSAADGSNFKTCNTVDEPRVSRI